MWWYQSSKTAKIIWVTLDGAMHMASYDLQSLWEKANFDPQSTKNRWTDRHQIWMVWLRHGPCHQKKIWAQSAQGLLLHI